MEAYETFTHNGHTIEIHADHDAESPRDVYPLGTFWTQERRHNSPDKMPKGANVFDSVAQTFGGIATAESNAAQLDKKAVWLPVWKYEHSGVAYRAAPANPFHCPWDSGQVGYVFVSLEGVRKEYGVKRVTKAIRAEVLEVLGAEVEAYSRWANGEYVGYIVKDSEGEEVDSCWGIDCIEYARQEARAAAE